MKHLLPLFLFSILSLALNAQKSQPTLSLEVESLTKKIVNLVQSQDQVTPSQQEQLKKYTTKLFNDINTIVEKYGADHPQVIGEINFQSRYFPKNLKKVLTEKQYQVFLRSWDRQLFADNNLEENNKLSDLYQFFGISKPAVITEGSNPHGGK